MFEQAFLPFLEERSCQGLSDPIDQCVKHYVSSAVEKVSWVCPNNQALIWDRQKQSNMVDMFLLHDTLDVSYILMMLIVQNLSE